MLFDNQKVIFTKIASTNISPCIFMPSNHHEINNAVQEIDSAFRRNPILCYQEVSNPKILIKQCFHSLQGLYKEKHKYSCKTIRIFVNPIIADTKAKRNRVNEHREIELFMQISRQQGFRNAVSHGTKQIICFRRKIPTRNSENLNFHNVMDKNSTVLLLNLHFFLFWIIVRIINVIFDSIY